MIEAPITLHVLSQRGIERLTSWSVPINYSSFQTFGIISPSTGGPFLNLENAQQLCVGCTFSSDPFIKSSSRPGIICMRQRYIHCMLMALPVINNASDILKEMGWISHSLVNDSSDASASSMVLRNLLWSNELIVHKACTVQPKCLPWCISGSVINNLQINIFLNTNCIMAHMIFFLVQSAGLHCVSPLSLFHHSYHSHSMTWRLESLSECKNVGELWEILVIAYQESFWLYVGWVQLLRNKPKFKLCSDKVILLHVILCIHIKLLYGYGD